MPSPVEHLAGAVGKYALYRAALDYLKIHTLLYMWLCQFWRIWNLERKDRPTNASAGRRQVDRVQPRVRGNRGMDRITAIPKQVIEGYTGEAVQGTVAQTQERGRGRCLN